MEEIVEIFMYFIKDILLPQNRNARSINFVQISKCLAYNYNYMSHTPSYNQSNIFRVQIKEKKVFFIYNKNICILLLMRAPSTSQYKDFVLNFFMKLIFFYYNKQNNNKFLPKNSPLL